MTSQEAAVLRTMLEQRNMALRRDWTQLVASLSGLAIPALLEPYRDRIVAYCRHYGDDAEANLALLQLQNNSILEDLLSRTQVATNYLRAISGRFATPVLRSSESDTLCLKILNWIHQAHPQTVSVPAAFTSGDVAVLPLMGVVPIYFFPGLEQGGLLFQPLHFHEFGHCLYVLHKPEMDELIKELQESISDVLMPLSQRNDPHAAEAAKKQQSVVSRWFEWSQEIFCDAVGLTLGGPAYLYAFSMYCNNLSRGDLYLPNEELERSKHPVTWLRIRLLVDRARELGISEAATSVEQEWNTLSGVMRIAEDYQGYYEELMREEVHRVISDMLSVASPRPFLPDEVAPEGETRPDDNPVSLLNRAWLVHNANPDQYAVWETQAIAAYAK